MKTHQVHCAGSALIPMAGTELAEWMTLNQGENLEISLHGHSIPQHRLFFSYLRWHYADYKKELYPSFHIYRREMALEWGWTESYSIVTAGGEKFTRIVPRGMSHEECNREEFNSLVQLASERIGAETGITMEDYAKAKREYVDNQPGAKP